MNSTRKIMAVAALAVGAVPAAALAEKPAQPGERGRANAERKEQRAAERRAERHPQARAREVAGSRRVKRVGFVVKGVDVTGLAVGDGRLSGPFTLDPVAANKHARAVLGLTRGELRGEGTRTLGEAGDAVVVRYRGLRASDAPQPTDVVKVVGKVTRARRDDAAATRHVDIRGITVTRRSEAGTATGIADGAGTDARD